MADSNGVATLFDGVQIPTSELRLELATALFNGTGRALGARAGRRPGLAGAATVSDLTVTIPPNVATADPGWTNTQGPYPVAWTQPQTVVLDARPTSNSRIDLIFVQVFDNIFDSQGQGKAVRFAVAKGTAAANPSPPTTLNDGTTPISRVTVLYAATVPSSGAVTLVAGPASVASGGILPVNGTSEYPAAATAEEGTALWDLLLHDLVVKIGGTGGSWSKRDTRPMPTFQAGSNQLVADGNGVGSITYPGGAFATAPFVIAVPGSTNGGFSSVAVGTPTTTTFTVVARNSTGALMAGSTIRVNWLALVMPS